MWKYIVKRLLSMIPVVLGVSILIFTIMYFVPGDPARISLGPNATEQQIVEKRAELGLDQPYFIQLGSFMKSVFLEFDFGESYFAGSKVIDELKGRFPRTLALAFFSMVLSVLIGVPLGITSAVNQNTWKDSTSMLVSLAGVSIPPFWFGMILVIIFSLNLGLLPSSGIASPVSYILPIMSCSLGGIAMLARQTRSSMLEVIRADYIVTARAKGIKESRVIYHHALRNALIPIITSAGMQFGILMGGALIVETVFTIPGIGLYIMKGLNSRDYPVVRSCVIFTSIVFSLIMLGMDLIYAYVDPRIKGQYAGTKIMKRKKAHE